MQRYLTTPIYYASGEPHLGHAYTTIVADCYRRFYELQGDDVRLATGTDEHGQKIERLATAAGISPQAFVDPLSERFRDLWRGIGIEVDAFVRTTDDNHAHFALAIWRRLVDAGDIYKDVYKGLYCVACEQYFTEGAVCPVHARPLEHFEEPAFFFRLSSYQARLIEHIELHPEFILPLQRRNEVLAFLKQETLRDLAVSRASTRWGIPVPGTSGHVLYVWIDALASYLTALAGGKTIPLDAEELLCWWRNTTHFIGKDILTFHAIYWPAILFSAGLPLPRQLVVNGWLTMEGRKIAKSDPETFVDPIALTAQIGCDGLSWYLLKNVGLGQDLDFSRAAVESVVNSDLANNLGNLVSRFAKLANSRFPQGWQCHFAAVASSGLPEQVGTCAREVQASFAAGNPAQGARSLIELSAGVNAWFQQQAPWQVEDREALAGILGLTHHVLADISVLASPFVPALCQGIRETLCLPASCSWDDVGEQRRNVRVATGQEPLYARRGVDL